MNDERTKSRPYAKAVFNLALETKQLDSWSQALMGFAQVFLLCDKKRIMRNPRVSYAERLSLFQEVFSQFSLGENLLRLLILRKKLYLLPEISILYHEFLDEYEHKLNAEVVTAMAIEAGQQEKILQLLEKKYEKKILLQCKVDARLIGGVIIKIGDHVVDGSICGKLQRLKAAILT